MDCDIGSSAMSFELMPAEAAGLQEVLSEAALRCPVRDDVFDYIVKMFIRHLAPRISLNRVSFTAGVGPGHRASA
jgi:hypothetical protein